MLRQRFALRSIVGKLFHSTSTEDHLISNDTFERLPDLVIINILSRLPMDCILKCRMVCRLWQTLISSHYFATLHHDREWLFVQYEELGFYVLEENDAKEKVLKKVNLKHELTMKKCHPCLLHSCQGLLLFSDYVWPSTYFVFNPITREEITINTLGTGSVCGFYLCPLTGKFKILYVQVQGDSCEYMIHTMGSQTWRPISSSSVNSVPSYLTPAIANGAMHWIMDREFGKEDEIPPCLISILTFRLDTEELSLMSHPGQQCSSRQSPECRTHETMSLLVKEEHLSFCQLYIHGNVMDIWILEDYEMWAWFRRYTVNLNLDVNVFPYHFPGYYCQSELMLLGMTQFVKPLSIQDGELLICWFLRGLFLYNLDHSTLRRIEGPQGQSSTLTPISCMPYSKSLRRIDPFI